MILVFIVLLLVIYSFVQINILNKDYVNLFGYTFFQVKSGSMEEAIKVEDIVIEKIIDSDYDLQLNDIVSFKEGNSIITHRIIAKSDDTITTKGDANNSEDEPIERKEVIGKVVKIIPNISIWKNVFKTKSVYIMLTITIILFIIIFSIDTENTENTENIKNKEAKEKVKKINEKKEK
jgi:signal peptidase